MTTDPSPASPPRLDSIDVYRGLVMFLMLAEVLHLQQVANAIPESSFWKFLAFHQSHVPWVGCSLHDLIQPSFSFLVGTALAFSVMKRSGSGQSMLGQTIHAFWRAFVLVALGIFLRSLRSTQTNYTFEDTLTQIGLGYGFLFLLAHRPRRDQWIALGVLLVGYWLAFAIHPLPPENFDWKAVGVGVKEPWEHFQPGFMAHWDKNSNLAWEFDRWFLNLFPRKAEFKFNSGGYATLSFIPTLATMILGLLAGGILLREERWWWKVRWLLVAGTVCLFAGWGLGQIGVCPVVKRIWTPSWVLFSGGWCFLFLAGFYKIIDGWGFNRWAFLLKVIGCNSIAAYVLEWLLMDGIVKAVERHLGTSSLDVFGTEFRPLVQGTITLVIFWLMLLWMYRRKLFVRI